MDKNDYYTPCYVIDMKKFKKNCENIMKPFQERWNGNVKFGYSVKTNHNATLIKYAKEELGWYIETVSPNEYEQARLIAEPDQIIFNGPCKGKVLYSAYEQGSIVNIDSISEAQELCDYVKNAPNKEFSGKLGIRINFDLEDKCPGETTAGKSVSRFGVCYENGDFKKVRDLFNENGIKINGIHLHTSTKSRSRKIFETLAEMAVVLETEYEIQAEYIDIGGGFFGGQIIEGKPTMEEYAESICEILKKAYNPQTTQIILEPGASVVSTCVDYITKVINTREIRKERVITVDGTSLHINPFLRKRVPVFELFQEENSSLEERRKVRKQIICGCTCMEDDRFFEIDGADVIMKDDKLVFRNAGAYTMSFNSHFIIRPPKVYFIYE